MWNEFLYLFPLQFFFLYYEATAWSPFLWTDEQLDMITRNVEGRVTKLTALGLSKDTKGYLSLSPSIWPTSSVDCTSTSSMYVAPSMIDVGSLAHSTLTSRPSSSLNTSEPSWSRVHCGWGRTLHGAHGSEHIHFVSKWRPSYNEPSNWMHHNTPRRILDALLKQRCHRHGIYKMELIYVQRSRQNGKYRFMHLLLTYTNVFMNHFGLDRYKICWRLRSW